jgi:DNA modification methylase
LVTDPPYNVNYKGRGKKTSKGIANDNLANDNFQFFLDDAYRLINEHTKPECAWYTYHGREREECFKETVSKYSTIKAQIVWNKTIYNHVGGSYKRKHELCFYSVKGDEKFYGDGIFQADVEEIDRDTITPEKLMDIIKANREAEKHGMTSIWTEKRENTQLYIHPTQKPVRLIEKMILNSSLIGQTILDPFL